MKTQETKLMYAQDVYAQRNDRLFCRTNKELKKLLQEYCRVRDLDLSKILNDTLIWIACKRKIINLPFRKTEQLKLEDWWDSKDDPKPKIFKINKAVNL